MNQQAVINSLGIQIANQAIQIAHQEATINELREQVAQLSKPAQEPTED